MGYATISHVQAFAPQRVFSATSVPNTSQVAQFLTERAGEIDALLLAIGYSLPVPAGATVALAALERANALGAWADVEAAAPISDDVERAQKAWDTAYARLDPEQKGPTVQLDLARDSTEAFARGKTIDEAGIASSAVFSMDMEL